MLAQKIKELEEQLKVMKKNMLCCKHEFNKPYQITVEELVPVFIRYEGKGSDPEPVYEFRKRPKLMWEKECEICGYTQKTEKTKPVIERYEPDF